MADALTIDVKTSVNWSFQNPLALGTVSDVSKLAYTASLSDGTDANEVDKLWHDQRILSPTAYEDLDLTSLTNTVFGNTITISFAKVKLVLIINTSTTSGDDLLVGGAGSANNAWSAPFNADQDAKIGLPADSTLLLMNKPTGWTVTNSASDKLRIHNPTGNSITYKIALVGTSI